MKIDSIISYLEELAPLCFQEEYDNSGLIIGDKSSDFKSALIALDCTEEVLNEAIEMNCNLLITHHPLIFKPIKKLTGSNPIERIIIKAIKHNLCIYSMHTNLDNVKYGVNKKIADIIGVENVKILSPKKNLLRQLVVYCPKKDCESLRLALFQAGAGSIGDYDYCSFNLQGKGTFRPLQNANPHVGDIGKIHTEDEERIEVVYSLNKEKEILSAMQESHPYEQIAYQLYTLENLLNDVGSGMIGDLAEPIEVDVFLTKIKDDMRAQCIRYTDAKKKFIRKVAICGGSGSFLLKEAKNSGADIYISSDFKYHEFFDSESIIIADIGHYESEQFTKNLIHDLLSKKFTNFAFLLSKTNTNPIKYL